MNHPTITAPAAIADHGWCFYEKCNCIGMLTYKYRHPDHRGYELQWYPRYAKWSMKHYEATIYNSLPVSQMDKTLNEAKYEN